MSEFIKAIGIFYKNELNAIKKSGVQLQPVYEAFSNAWESIEERFHGELMRHGRIRMEFHYTMGLFKNDAENRTATLDKIVIVENGIGINPSSYDRLLTLRDNSKSIRNYCCPLKVSEQRDIHPQCCCNGIADDFYEGKPLS